MEAWTTPAPITRGTANLLSAAAAIVEKVVGEGAEGLKRVRVLAS